MDGMDRTSRPQFQPSQLGIRQYPDIPAGLDAIFEAYQRRKMMDMQMGMQMKQAGLQETQTKVGIASQGILPPGEETGSPYDQLVQEFIAKKQRETQTHEASLEPKSIEALLVQKVNRGEMTLEDAMKYKLEQSTMRPPPGFRFTQDKGLEAIPGGPALVKAPPPGYRFKSDGTLEAIPGGPAEAKVEAKEEKESAANQAHMEQASRVIEKVRQAKALVGRTTAGVAVIAKDIPGTSAKDLNKTIETIKANLGFAELQAMRQSSPTGGALGQVAVQELEALQATVASLDQGQSPDRLTQSLQEVEDHYTKWLETVGAKSGPGSAPKSAKPQTIVERVLKTGERVKVRKLPNGGWEKVE